jgi:hypothetical protein
MPPLGYGQYRLIGSIGSDTGDDRLALWELTEDDELVELDSLPPQQFGIIDRTLVDPRGEWVYFSIDPGDIGEFVRVGADDKLELVQILDDNHYESLSPSLRPDGSGVVLAVTDEPGYYNPHYLQYYRATPQGLVPQGVSTEFNIEVNPVDYTAITQWGEYTLVSVFDSVRRTHHLTPGGEIGLATEDIYWESQESGFDPKTLATSRDGRLLIAAGVGNVRRAVSNWVEDDGTVSERDSLFHEDFEDGLTLGYEGTVNTIIVSPHRDFVIFHANRPELWELHPDGTFGDMLWRSDREFTYGAHASLSADGRVLVTTQFVWLDDGQGGLYGTWAASIFRLGSLGEVLSENFIELPINYRMDFVTRRAPGDVNGDGWIDAADIACLLNHLSGAPITNPVDFDNADVNRSGNLTEDDVQALVEVILN